MNSPYIYSKVFTLNKQYLAECYDQSCKFDHSLRAYARGLAIILTAGVLLTFTPIDTYITAFIFVIGVIDAANIYYNKAWWLARQAWGSTYNKEINLSINEEGITTRATGFSNKILWADITKIQPTEKGLLVHHTKGKDYLSNSCLDNAVITYLHSQISSS